MQQIRYQISHDRSPLKPLCQLHTTICKYHLKAWKLEYLKLDRRLTNPLRWPQEVASCAAPPPRNPVRAAKACITVTNHIRKRWVIDITPSVKNLTNSSLSFFSWRYCFDRRTGNLTKSTASKSRPPLTHSMPSSSPRAKQSLVSSRFLGTSLCIPETMIHPTSSTPPYGSSDHIVPCDLSTFTSGESMGRHLSITFVSCSMTTLGWTIHL